MYSETELLIFSILNTYESIRTSTYKIFKFSINKKINIFSLEIEELKKLFSENFLLTEIQNEYFFQIYNEYFLKNILIEINFILTECKKNFIELIFYNSKNYPLSLLKLKNPPYVLFIKGRLPQNNILQNSIALVGTRRVSSVGVEITKDIGNFLVENKIYNISGLAIGVDTLGHFKTLGQTGAILGQGLLLPIYPKENKKLSEEILANNGFLLSELPPHTNISIQNLIDRNRFQTALTSSIIIAETSLKGGTIHTFKFAKKLKKRIFVADINVEFIKKYEKDIIAFKKSSDLKVKFFNYLNQKSLF